MKRRLKYRGWLMLAVVCCLLGCAAGAFAQEENFSFWGYDPLVSDISLYARVPIFDYDTEAFYQKVSAGINKWSDRIDVSAFRFTVEECSWAYNAMRYTHPEIFQVTSMFWYWDNASGYVTAIRPDYCVSKAELPARKALYEQGVEAIVDYAMEADTELGRLMRANDYICINYEYDYDLEMRRADDVIESRECVCEGYTALYTAALKRMGITTTFVLSDAMNHIWNAVLLDGDWYHIDVTWNDPSFSEIAIPQLVHHTNFILSDEGIANEGHYGWTVPFTADNTKYDDFFWRDVQQAAAMADDVMYYGVFSGGYDQAIWSYDFANGKNEKVRTYYGSYYGYPSHVWTAKDVLYYTDGPKLYALPLAGGSAKLVYHAGSDDAKLWYPSQSGNDLLLYVASWLYYTDGSLLRFPISSAITELEPEALTHQIGFQPQLGHVRTGKELKLWAWMYPAPQADYAFTWTSSDPDIAVVDEQGRVTAKRAGIVQITAAYGSSAGTCTLAVSGTGEMALPASTVTIEREAFRGIAAGCVSLPETVTFIGEKAFADSAVDILCLPGSLEYIAEDAFLNNEDVILVVPADSEAEAFAIHHHMDWAYAN